MSCQDGQLLNHTVGGPHGRVGKVAEFQPSSSFDHLTAATSVRSNPALATCETSQVLLAGVSGGFPGVLPFRLTSIGSSRYESNNLERDVKLNKKQQQKQHCSWASLPESKRQFIRI